MSKSTQNANDPFALQTDYTQSASDLLLTETAEAASVEKQQPAAVWSMLRELLETIVLSLVIFLLIRLVIQNYRIESHSMQPNFFEGEFILVNKLAFKLGEPSRGEVIVFHNPGNTEEDYIKRVIGLPGDQVEVRDQTVYVNGQELVEPYATNPFRDNYGPMVVPDNHLFVMGDNRGNSSDSRRIGPIPEELIVGQAWLRVWPFDRWGLIKHYELEPGRTTEVTGSTP
ncbi:MAG: signal peptidase I [Caldilineaceae bacterium]|nr:signal peptidase I [Caldilineaceae bacterium]